MTHVYVIEAEGGLVKVGMSVDPKNRMRELRRVANTALTLAHVEPIGNRGLAAEIERAAHVILADCHVIGEWFAVDAEYAKSAIARARTDIENKFRTNISTKYKYDLGCDIVHRVPFSARLKSETRVRLKTIAYERGITIGEAVELAVSTLPAT